MGVLADLYVSSPERAADYAVDPTPFKQEAASWNQFTPLELSMLWASLQGQEWDGELMDRFEEVLVEDGGERSITRLPDDFLRNVLAADDNVRDEALTNWAGSEELDCDVAEVRPFWDDLRRLAEVAVRSGRGLFLWNAL